MEELTAMFEQLVAQERHIVQGVALGEMTPEVLEAWGDTYGGRMLAVLRDLAVATIDAVSEMERLGITVVKV